MVQVVGKKIKYWCSLSSDHYVGIVEKNMSDNYPYVYMVKLLRDGAKRYIGEGQIVKIYKDGEIIPEQHEEDGSRVPRGKN